MAAGKTIRPILIAASAGLLLRLAWLALAEPAPVSDFEYYRRLASHLLDNHQLGEWRPTAARVPIYPLFLAAAMLVSRSVVWLSVVNIAVSTVLIVVVAKLAEMLTGRRSTAVVAAWICALNPTFVFFAPVLASEPLFVVLLLSSLIALLAKRPAWAGVLYGAAILTRPDGLFYAPVLALLALTAKDGRRGLARWRPLAICAVVTAVILVPWLVRNRVMVGRGAGLTTIGGINFYYAHNDRHYGWHPLDGTPLYGLEEVPLQQRAYELGIDHIRRHGLSGLVATALAATPQLYSPMSYPFALHWSTRTVGPTPDDNFDGSGSVPGYRIWRWLTRSYALILAGAVLSLAVIWKLPARAPIVLLGVVACNWVAYCWISWADPRHRYVAEIMFCVLAACLIIEVAVRWSGARRIAAER